MDLSRRLGARLGDAGPPCSEVELPSWPGDASSKVARCGGGVSAAGEGWGCGTVVDLGPAAVRAARGAEEGDGFNGSIEN